ncbi:predicted protein [Nematostella vectensis]|uniref:Nucleolus and neural progenitor protein-like N-terminal domain-containing protein n=1 Tax=Nematostella vectensis TaxID=45351 RepID=A7S7Z8_NEMVE|nr:predicted protein [Nematostella vectensis]|eukprot:XP_001632271.1 predicted protein [Nematostella vectensis]
MADEAWWNRRLSTNQTLLPVVSCHLKVEDLDVIKTAKHELSLLSCNLMKNQLWTEMRILHAVIYKNNNQHKKEKYFQGLKKIHKYLNSLEQMSLGNTLVSLVKQLPKIKQESPPIAGLSLPCVRSVENMLVQFIGAAKLAFQIIEYSKTIFQLVMGQMVLGFFLRFHVVNASCISRLSILLKDFCQNLFDGYKCLFELIKVLRTAENADLSETLHLPTCLKTWLGADKSVDEVQSVDEDTVKSTANQSVSLLDKLFAESPVTDNKPRAKSSTMLPSSDSNDVGEVVSLDEYMPHGRLIKEEKCVKESSNSITAPIQNTLERRSLSYKGLAAARHDRHSRGKQGVTKGLYQRKTNKDDRVGHITSLVDFKPKMHRIAKLYQNQLAMLDKEKFQSNDVTSKKLFYSLLRWKHCKRKSFVNRWKQRTGHRIKRSEKTSKVRINNVNAKRKEKLADCSKGCVDHQPVAMKSLMGKNNNAEIEVGTLDLFQSHDTLEQNSKVSTSCKGVDIDDIFNALGV